jgi:hypothetical protein
VFAIAVCALAVTAGSASATFHAASYPAKITAKNLTTHTFTVGSAIVECTESNFFSTGAAAADSSQLKVLAVYKGCKFTALNTAATVNMNGCSYNFHQAAGALEGPVSLECPTGSKIKIETTGCEVFVGPTNNSNLKKVSYVNNAGGTVEVKAEVAGISYTSNGGLACAIGGIKEGKTSEYKGGAKAVGFTAAGASDKIELI